MNHGYGLGVMLDHNFCARPNALQQGCEIARRFHI
jgi:hypothetical protein